MVKDSIALTNYFATRNRIECSAIIDKIVAECKITRSTFFNWKYGICRIPQLHKDKIEEILGEKIFNAFTNSII